MDISRVRFQSLRPMLRTKDLRATIEFYTWRLGFTCDGMSEADGWASLRRDSVSVMVATPNAHTPFDTPVFTGSLYFNDATQSGQNRCCSTDGKGRRTGTIFLLGPSAQIRKARPLVSSLGLPNDGEDYHAKVLMSEYIPIGH